jgi:hypothetical protein
MPGAFDESRGAQRRGRLHLCRLGFANAVPLGLVFITLWEGFFEAADRADREATQLAEVYWLAHRLPEPEGPHIQELARSYTEVVVDEEWPLMREGRVGRALRRCCWLWSSAGPGVFPGCLVNGNSRQYLPGL